MMTSVVENGSGRRARIPGVTVAGKTGTAENAGPDHNWFIGFAPADDPQIAVAVFVANGGRPGGDISPPTAPGVMQAYLDGQGGSLPCRPGRSSPAATRSPHPSPPAAWARSGGGT